MRALSSLSTQKKTIHPRGRERRGKIRTTARQTLSLSLSPFSLSIIIIKANCAESICTEFTRRRTLFYRNARSGEEEEEEEEEEDGEIQKLQNNNNNNKTHRIRTRSVKTRSPRLQPQPRAVVCCSDSTRFGLVAAFLFSLFFSRDDDDDDDEKSDSLSLSLSGRRRRPDDGDARVSLFCVTLFPFFHRRPTTTTTFFEAPAKLLLLLTVE